MLISLRRKRRSTWPPTMSRRNPSRRRPLLRPICTKALPPAGALRQNTSGTRRRPYDEKVFQRWDRYNRIGPDKYISGMRLAGELQDHGRGLGSQPEAGVLGATGRCARAVSFIKGARVLEEPFEIGLYLQRNEHSRLAVVHAISESKRWDFARRRQEANLLFRNLDRQSVE